MVQAIPFGKLQKIWAVIWGDAFFLRLLLACSADLNVLCSGWFSHHVKLHSFYFYVQISTRVVLVTGKHLWAQMCPNKFTTTQCWPSLNSNLKMANTFFKFDRWAIPNEHFFLWTPFLTYIANVKQSLYLTITAFPLVSALTLSLLEHVVACLVPRPHYFAWPIRFGSRGPSEPSSETSPKCINREGLGKRRTGTIGNAVAR